MHTHRHTHAQHMHACTHTCMHSHTHTHTHTHIHIHTHKYTHTHTHTKIHTHTHSHTHTHTHTHTYGHTWVKRILGGGRGWTKKRSVLKSSLKASQLVLRLDCICVLYKKKKFVLHSSLCGGRTPVFQEVNCACNHFQFYLPLGQPSLYGLT